MDWLLFLAAETLVLVMLTLSVASMTLTYLWSNSEKFKQIGAKNFEQLFVTARNAGSTWLLFWAMYSSMAGAWLVPSAGINGYLFGLTGIVTVSMSIGGSCFLTTSLSILAYKQLPETCSLPQSVGLRYGRPLELYTLVVMLLATLCSLVKEYLVLILVLEEVLSLDTRIVLGIATAVSICYICYGGALVGLFIDQIHGALGMAALLVVVYYVGTSAKDYSPLSRAMLLYGFDENAAHLSVVGGILFPLTVQPYFEVLWQKHICSRVKRDLWVSSVMASVLVALTCAAWGVPGMVAAWKGIAEHSYGFWGTSYVLYIDKAWHGVSIRNLWAPWSFWLSITYLTAVLIPSQAAIYAWSNAFLSSIYASLRLPKHRLVASRAAALALNGLALFLASMKLSTLGVTILPSMVGASLTAPLFLSVCSPYLYKRATGAIILTSAFAGLLATSLHGLLRVRSAPGGEAMPRGELLRKGMMLAFYVNMPTWDVGAVSLGAPLAVYALLMTIKAALPSKKRRHHVTFAGH